VVVDDNGGDTTDLTGDGSNSEADGGDTDVVVVADDSGDTTDPTVTDTTDTTDTTAMGSGDSDGTDTSDDVAQTGGGFFDTPVLADAGSGNSDGLGTTPFGDRPHRVEQWQRQRHELRRIFDPVASDRQQQQQRRRQR
jgi:hypothetical protein